MNITYLVLFRYAALLNNLNKECDLLNYLITDQSNWTQSIVKTLVREKTNGDQNFSSQKRGKEH